MAVADPPITIRVASAGRYARLEVALPWLALAVAGIGLPLLDDSYVGVIAQRACIYWILVAGLNLVVGFAGQIAIGWVALLTVGVLAAHFHGIVGVDVERDFIVGDAFVGKLADEVTGDRTAEFPAVFAR